VHHLRSIEMVGGLSLMVCGRSLELERSLQNDGMTVVTALVPAEGATTYGGRLWLSIGYNDNHGGRGHDKWVSFSQLELIRPVQFSRPPAGGPICPNLMRR
jgi:hypothetical protein